MAIFLAVGLSWGNFISFDFKLFFVERKRRKKYFFLFVFTFHKHRLDKERKKEIGSFVIISFIHCNCNKYRE